MKRILFYLLASLVLLKLIIVMSGCAQVISPTGGQRDTIPPKLLNVRPPQATTNFTGNRITFNFDEYIVVDQLRENLLVSPNPKNDPYVNFKLKTVTVKLRDTLLANTTYTIDLGNAVRDNNENNILKNFSYVFSTGPLIDSLTFSGQVQLAETGKADSTLQVYLYNKLDDSAVYKKGPKYIARLDSSGSFFFRNLAPATYNVFALKDADGQKTYNSKSEMFAFYKSPVKINSPDTSLSLHLYAYQEEKDPGRPTKTLPSPEKKLKYSLKVPVEKQDILNNLIIDFNKPLKQFDSLKIILTDTLYHDKNAAVSLDSTSKKVIVNYKWLPDSVYELIILKDFGNDSTGLVLAKSDTIRFKTKAEKEYGSIKINFLHFNKESNQVLQFVKNDIVFKSYLIPGATWSAPLFEPGEYELRILFDENNNGVWDTGNYHTKKEPEKVFHFVQKLNIKANWENERDIELPRLP